MLQDVQVCDWFTHWVVLGESLNSIKNMVIALMRLWHRVGVKIGQVLNIEAIM